MATKAKGKKLPQRRYTPFAAPSRPPAGTYDPALDAQERAAQRGYQDLLADIERQRGYDYTDTYDPTIGSIAELTRGRDDSLLNLNRGLERGVFDLTRSRDRGLQDIGTSRTRGEEDYGRSVEELQRNFRILGGQQTEAARAMGVQRGGALAQSARKRAENEAFERVPLDRGIARLRQDLTRDETRLGEDFTTQKGRIDQDYWTNILRLDRDYNVDVQRANTNYARGEEGRGVQQSRAGRELGEYRLDTNQQRFFQATQSGYELPTRPANEITRAGQTAQVQGQNKPVSQRTYTLPSGQQLNRKQWVGFIRRRRQGGTPQLYG